MARFRHLETPGEKAWRKWLASRPVHLPEWSGYRCGFKTEMRGKTRNGISRLMTKCIGEVRG